MGSLYARALLTALLFAGCTGSDPALPLASAGDGGGDSIGDSGTSPPIDDAATPRRCSPTDPFIRLGPVRGLNTTAIEIGSDVSDDQLEMWLSVLDGSEYGVARATRATTNDAWSVAMAAGSTVNLASQSAFGASMSSDRRTLFFSAKASGDAANTYELFTATRTQLAAEFTGVTRIDASRLGQQDGWPRMRRDGAELCFGAGDAGPPYSYNFDIYCAAVVNGVAQPPAAVSELNSGAADDAPVFSHDGLTLYFASSRETGAIASQSIWTSSRPSLEGRWSAPVRAAGLGGDGAISQPVWISEDQCTLYFTTNRDPAQDFDVWIASR